MPGHKVDHGDAHGHEGSSQPVHDGESGVPGPGLNACGSEAQVVALMDNLINELVRERAQVAR